MIKVKNGTVEIEGSSSSILADITVLLRSISDSFISHGIPKEEADYMIDKAVKLSRMSEESIEKEAKELLLKMLLGGARVALAA